jgi:hypothetical protein
MRIAMYVDGWNMHGSMKNAGIRAYGSAASATTLPIWIRATVTVFPSVVSGGMVVCATSSGALSGTCKTSILN